MIYRVRVRRGGRKRTISKGIVFGKPATQGVNQLKWSRIAVTNLLCLRTFFASLDALDRLCGYSDWSRAMLALRIRGCAADSWRRSNCSMAMEHSHRATGVRTQPWCSPSRRFTTAVFSHASCPVASWLDDRALCTVLALADCVGCGFDAVSGRMRSVPGADRGTVVAIVLRMMLMVCSAFAAVCRLC